MTTIGPDPEQFAPTPSSASAAPAPPDYLIVGQIVAAFGVAGEMKVNIHTEFPERFSTMRDVVVAPFSYVETAAQPDTALSPSTAGAEAGEAPAQDSAPPRPTRRPLRPRTKPNLPTEPTTYAVQSTRIHKKQLLLKIAGVNTPEDAEELRGFWVMVPLEKAKRLPRGSYYLYELLGLEVYATDDKYIGKLAQVLTMSANDVYVVRGPGVTDATGELLVPAIKAVVKEIDINRGRMLIAPPEEWS